MMPSVVHFSASVYIGGVLVSHVVRYRITSLLKCIIFMYLYTIQVSVELIPLLQQCDLEKLGVIHVGERVMLVSLAKALERKPTA